MALPEPSHEKELKHIRIIQKHETEANWNKATKFIPKLGEVIIYDPDANHTTSRIKIGDGTTVVANLPFVQQGFIDSELSNTSENAVQNKVIKNELSTKANKVISNMSYESFIDTYHLREPEWVDLSFVGGEYYYTDFNTAVTDVNNGNTAGASSDKTGAICQIFTDGNITVLRLLSDITITTNIVFTKSVIFDINGFTVTVRDLGRIGSQTVAYDISVIFYGSKTDSNILSTNMLVMFANTSNFFLIGGKYSINSSLAGAYVIYVPPYNIPINIEIYNAELQVVYNNPQSTNNISCVIVTNKTSITNLLINNTKCVTNGTNRYTYAYITTTAANPETKVTILNSDIEAYGADQGDNSPCGILISAGYANIISSNIKGITSGIQVGRQGNVYIKDSKCYAPYHGGVYNAHKLYAENTEFHRSATPEGYTPTGTGCAYFGYGSTTYLNNCKFIRDVESDTSPGIVIRKEGTPEGKTTRVFVSNSEMPGIRCDADQEIYLGNGISDTIKNATVQGTKYLTDNNYVYIEDKGAYSLLNPNAIIASESYVDTEVAKNKIIVDTTLSSTSTNPVQNKVVNTALAGKANASHTHNLNDVTIKTAFNTTGSVDYVSRSLIPYVSGTKFYGMPAAAITVEYSRDGGVTWIDYGLDNGAKMRIFDHSGGANLYLGKASTKADNNIKNMLRITVDATKSDGRCLSTDSMFTWMSSNGNTTCVTLEVASYSAPTTFRTIVDNAPINGWSGPNMSHYSMITFGGSTAGSTSPNNQFYRLTYKQTAINSNYSSALIGDIRFFGSTVWGGGKAIANGMLKYGAPYSVRIDPDSASGAINFNLLGATFGNGTAANGKYSLAGGFSTTTGHEGSIAYGEALNTSARCQAIFGRYNATNSSALLQVGNGSSAGVKTAFSVFNDGHAEVQTQGTTDNSVVIKSELPTIITF